MKTRCRKCQKMFENFGVLGLNKCPDCISPYEGPNKAQAVRDLVKENPGISASYVSSIMGLPTVEIIKYIRAEVLEFSDNSSAYLRCEDCGTEIKTGKYCDSCKINHKAIVKMSSKERHNHGKIHEHIRYNRKK